MDAQPGSPKEKELALFALLVEQYEQDHFPIAPPDPVEAILFRMDHEGLTRNNLTADSCIPISHGLRGDSSI